MCRLVTTYLLEYFREWHANRILTHQVDKDTHKRAIDCLKSYIGYEGDV